MRCPYCREEIHDQALKCPHCHRLLVDKPGWRRKRAGDERASVSGLPTASAAVGEVVEEPPEPSAAPGTGRVPTGSGRDGARPAARRRGPGVPTVVVLMATAALLGFLGGRTVTDAPVGFVSGDAELIAELEVVAEQRFAEIRRLRQRLAQAAAATPAPAQRELMAALGFCNQAFTMLVDREEALFADRPALVEFVRLSNQCLAPIDQQVEIPS